MQKKTTKKYIKNNRSTGKSFKTVKDMLQYYNAIKQGKCKVDYDKEGDVLYITNAIKQGKCKVDYDKEGDVLYITFGTGEPSYCEEVKGNDNLLIERGMYSKMPTGARVLNVSKLTDAKEVKDFAEINLKEEFTPEIDAGEDFMNTHHILDKKRR